MTEENSKLLAVCILVLFLGLFSFWLDNQKDKDKNNIQYELEEAKDKIGILEDDNLILNYKLCELGKNEDVDCEKIKKDIAIRLYIEKTVEEIYDREFKTDKKE